MDYTSFAPGKSSSPSQKPNLSRPELPSGPKQFTPKFLGVLVLILVVGGLAFAGIWYWQNQNNYDTYAPTYTPRPAATQYRNDQYGFAIALPQSWSGYTVMSGQWQGTDVASGKQTQSGPLITLRNPAWTQTNQTEDMPVMVFTPAQWQLVQQEKLAVSAAPIPPSLLGQNSKYVLALPARYNYDFKTGWQEVDQLVHTLKAFEPGQQQLQQ